MILYFPQGGTDLFFGPFHMKFRGRFGDLEWQVDLMELNQER